VKTVDEQDFLSALIEEGNKFIAETEAGSNGAEPDLPVGEPPDPVIPLQEIPHQAAVRE
jgi:hypothetical protein